MTDTDRRALVGRLLMRLIWLYNESWPIPDRAFEAGRPAPPLTEAQAIRLGLYIKREHEG